MCIFLRQGRLRHCRVKGLNRAKCFIQRKCFVCIHLVPVLSPDYIGNEEETDERKRIVDCVACILQLTGTYTKSWEFMKLKEIFE